MLLDEYRSSPTGTAGTLGARSTVVISRRRGLSICAIFAALAVAGCGHEVSSSPTGGRSQTPPDGNPLASSAGRSQATRARHVHATSAIRSADKNGGEPQPAARRASHYQRSVWIGGYARGRPLPNNYLGVAFTYRPIPGWVGPASEPVDPVLVQLIRNLAPHGRPLIRIGGESADHSWWPIPGYRKPFGITHDLTPKWTTAARRLAKAANARLMLGVDLQADRPRIVKVESHELLRRIGRRYIQSIQIGNEPNLYAVIPWYKLLNGHPVPQYSKTGTPVYARPASYNTADFADELKRMLGVMPKVAIAGPETNPAAWLAVFTGLLHSAGRPVMLTTHAYGASKCVRDPSQWMYPSVAHLLSVSASRDQLAGITQYIGVARSQGDGFRVDELGTVSCSGLDGVSNTMASALWVIDTLFSMDQAGVNGVNLHSVKGVNQLFTPRRSHGRWRASVGPWYYGALMFTKAAPAGSRLLPVANGTGSSTRVWATLGRDHAVRVLVINDSLRRPAHILVHNPPNYGRRPGTLERLGARSAYDKRGITLGGRSFGTITATGALKAPITRTIHRRDGTYVVDLPPASAGLLTLSRQS